MCEEIIPHRGDIEQSLPAKLTGSAEADTADFATVDEFIGEAAPDSEHPSKPADIDEFGGQFEWIGCSR